MCSRGSKSSRPHTPITSKAQRDMMGAELARRRAGKEVEARLAAYWAIRNLNGAVLSEEVS